MTLDLINKINLIIPITFFLIRKDGKFIKWGKYINKEYKVWLTEQDAMREEIADSEIVEISINPQDLGSFKRILALDKEMFSISEKSNLIKHALKQIIKHYI